jgi:hypothetical protein
VDRRRLAHRHYPAVRQRASGPDFGRHWPEHLQRRAAAFITSYDNWQPASWKNGSFDQGVDRFFDKSAFPNQNVIGIGNSTRYNPKLREFPFYNENVSLAKVFWAGERFSAEFTRRGVQHLQPGPFRIRKHNINAADFGRVAGRGGQINTPRQLQVGLKLAF